MRKESRFQLFGLLPMVLGVALLGALGGQKMMTPCIGSPDSPSGTESKDMALTDFTASPNPVAVGGTLTFSYTVKNVGTEREDAKIRVSVSGKVVVKPKELGQLAPGQSKSGTLTLKIGNKTQPGDIFFKGEVMRMSGEKNVANNSQTVKVTVQ